MSLTLKARKYILDHILTGTKGSALTPVDVDTDEANTPVTQSPVPIYDINNNSTPSSKPVKSPMITSKKVWTHYRWYLLHFIFQESSSDLLNLPAEIPLAWKNVFQSHMLSLQNQTNITVDRFVCTLVFWTFLNCLKMKLRDMSSGILHCWSWLMTKKLLSLKI